MMIYYLPVVDGKPAAWDGDQLAFCDDTSYWTDPPHRGRLYSTLSRLKGHIAASKKFREKRGWPGDSYGWIEIIPPERARMDRHQSGHLAGVVRAERLSPERRSEIARKGGYAKAKVRRSLSVLRSPTGENNG